MVTLSFLRLVLKGKKRLLKQSEILMIPKIPRVKEIDVASIWHDIRGVPEISLFFPEPFVSGNRLPNRTFMFTVGDKKILSTVFPEIFDKMVVAIGNARMQKEPEEEKIEIVPELLNELTSKKAYIFEGGISRLHQV